MIVLTVLCSETVTAAEDSLKRSLDQWWRFSPPAIVVGGSTGISPIAKPRAVPMIDPRLMTIAMRLKTPTLAAEPSLTLALFGEAEYWGEIHFAYQHSNWRSPARAGRPFEASLAIQ